MWPSSSRDCCTADKQCPAFNGNRIHLLLSGYVVAQSPTEVGNKGQITVRQFHLEVALSVIKTVVTDEDSPGQNLSLYFVLCSAIAQ